MAEILTPIIQGRPRWQPAHVPPSYEGTPWQAFRAAQDAGPLPRGAGFDLLPDIYQGRQVGITDRDAPSTQRQRQAFRGLFYRILQLRANAFTRAAGVIPRLTEGIEVVREVATGQYEPVEEAHPWRRIVQRPSPFYSAHYVWRWAQLTKDTSRGAFFLVEYDTRPGSLLYGTPAYLHPIFPWFGHVEPVGNGLGGIDGWIFHRMDGRRIPERGMLDRRQIAWLRHPHPVSPFESASLLEAAAYEIDVDLYMHIYRRDNLRRGGINPVYGTTEQELSTEQALELSLRFMDYYQGYENVGRIPMLSRGASLNALGSHARDLQFIEGADLTEKEIFNIGGVPQGMFRESANRANADAAALTFARETAQPEADDNCDQLTFELREAFGGPDVDRLYLRAPDLTPEDADMKLRVAQVLVERGGMTPAELRKEFRDEESLGGLTDVPHISAALRPVEGFAADTGTSGAVRASSDGDMVSGLLDPHRLSNRHFNQLLDRISTNGKH